MTEQKKNYRYKLAPQYNFYQWHLMIKHFLVIQKKQPLVKFADTLHFLLLSFLSKNKLLYIILFDKKDYKQKKKKFQKVYMVDGIPNRWIIKI